MVQFAHSLKQGNVNAWEAVSDVMLLLPGRNVLWRVLQVMKRLGQQLSA